MSLQENTTNLEEVLQKVRALPTASGTGGSLNKVLLGELNLNSSNLTKGTENGEYILGANEQAIMSNILSKAFSEKDIVFCEWGFSIMGNTQSQMAITSYTNNEYNGISINDNGAYASFFSSRVTTSGYYDDFIGAVANGQGEFNIKFYSLVGGSSSTTSGSLNKVLLGEFELNSTNLTDEESSSAPYYFSLGTDVQAVMSSVFSKASLGNDVIVVEMSGSTYRQIYSCDFNYTTSEYTNINVITLGTGFYRNYISCDQNMAMMLSMLANGNYEPMHVKFYALAGGSTGSDADLVIRVNGSPWEKLEPSNIVIEKGAIGNIFALANGNNSFKCELHFSGNISADYWRECGTVPARLWCYGDWVYISYVTCAFGRLVYGDIQLNSTDGRIITNCMGFTGDVLS